MGEIIGLLVIVCLVFLSDEEKLILMILLFEFYVMFKVMSKVKYIFGFCSFVS